MAKTEDAIDFGPFTFDPTLLELRKDGAPVHLQPQPAQVLALLLRTPGRLVTRDHLRQEIWKDRFLEFDGGLNYSIRQVRKVLGDDADTPIYIETVHGRGYRFIADVRDDARARHVSHHKPLAVRVAGAGAALAVLVLAFAWRGSSSPSSDALILAVLPFEVLDEGQSLQWFSRGITEDLITELAVLSPDRLRVVGLRSVMHVAAQTSESSTIGEQLDAGFVVRGTVRESDGERRITVSIDNTSDGTQLWGRRYDRVSGRDMTVQARIARDVAEALSLEFFETTVARGDDHLRPTLRDSVLVARWLLERPDGDDVRRGMRYLESIRATVPDYAAAWALTASGHLRLGDYDAADRAARRSRALDPAHAEAHFQLGLASMFAFRFDTALVAYQRAVELAPGIVRYRQWYAHFLGNLLRFEESIRHFEFAQHLDPVATALAYDLSNIYLAAERYDDAIAHCLSSLELVDATWWAQPCLLAAHYFDGDFDDAARVARDIMRHESATPEAIAAVQPDADGLVAYFRWNRDRLESADTPPFQYSLARVYAQLRDRERTLAILGQIVNDRLYAAQWMAQDVWFRFLYGDAEFEALLREVGLPIPSGPWNSVTTTSP